MKITTGGYVYVKADARTFADLREFVQQLEAWGVRDDNELDYGSGYIYVDLSPEDGNAEAILCGDCSGDKSDFVVLTHDCKPWHEQGSLFPEQRERWGKPAEREPSEYDWPAIDRYKRLLAEMGL